jgi:hypothetical protein
MHPLVSPTLKAAKLFGGGAVRGREHTLHAADAHLGGKSKARRFVTEKGIKIDTEPLTLGAASVC